MSNDDWEVNLYLNESEPGERVCYLNPRAHDRLPYA